MRIFTLILFFIVAQASVSHSSAHDNTHRLTKADGLTGLSVFDIAEDHFGEIWLATSCGIDRYNGVNVTSFHLPTDIPNPLVYRLAFSSDHCIYAATRAGIYCLMPKSEGFVRIMEDVSTADALCVVEDAVFVGNSDGLHILQGHKRRDVYLAGSPQHKNNAVRDVIKSDDGKSVYVLTNNALYIYDIKTDEYVCHPINLPKEVTLHNICAFGDRVFIGTKNYGLFLYTLSRRTITGIETPGKIINSLRKASDTLLAVASDGGGAFTVDVNNIHTVDTFSQRSQGCRHLVNDVVYVYMKDSRGIDWFGYNSMGASYVTRARALFHSYSYGEFDTSALEIRGFLINGTERLFGAMGGMYYVDESRGITRFYGSTTFSNSHLFTSAIPFRGRYYLGFFDGGLYSLSPRDLTVRREDIVSNTTVNNLCKDIDGNLWVCTTDGVFIFTTEGETMHFNRMNSNIPGTIVHGVVSCGKRWVLVSTNAGLSIYDTATATFINKFPQGFWNAQNNMRGMVGFNGKVMMYNATGFYYTTPDMKDFGRMNIPPGIITEACQGIVDDNDGHYYIASDNGLFRIAYDMKQCQHYNRGDHLFGDFIVSKGLQKDSSGRLWVATNQGLYYAFLKDLNKERNDRSGRVIVYDARVNDVELPQSKQYLLKNVNRIVIPMSFFESKLELRPLLLDYGISEGRLYEYKIDDGEWHLVKDGERITVSGLMLGEHRLYVRVSGSDMPASVITISVLFSTASIFVTAILVMLALTLLLWRRYKKQTDVIINEHRDIEDALLEEIALKSQNEQPAVQESASANTVSSKYRNARLSNEELVDIAVRMKEYVESSKCYLNQDLKMSDLADGLHVNPGKMSQVFSLYLRTNYYEFINEYRLNEFKRLIANGDSKRFTVVALSEKCGFKKSAFFATFRKCEGMSPSEYLRKQGV